MRHAVVVIAVLLSVSLSCLAQSKPRVTLDIGSVTVYLGMPRGEIVKTCAAAGYKQFVVDRDTVAFQIGGAIEVYTVQFRSDRVVYADREWYLEKGDLDPFLSTIAALGSLADSDKSPPSCTILHIPMRAPDRSEENIVISCGKRTIQLSQVKFNGAARTGYSVQEQIGERMIPR